MHSPRALTGLTLVSIAALVSGCGEPSGTPPAAADASTAATSDTAEAPAFEYRPVPVNRDLALPDGFRGEVHPLLFGDTALEVTARWSPKLDEAKREGIKLGVIDNAEAPEYSIPADLVALLTESRPVRERATYGARELSAFLPAEVGEAGQMWKIDPAVAVPLLAQFHPAVSTTFERYHQPYGRRPGPAGAFGILRAVSEEHLDVLFRVHAEIVLKEGAVIYTPACFLGRMLVDRKTGTVEHLRMSVPGEQGVNINITVTFPLPGEPGKEVTNIVFERVEPMELAGGDASAAAGPWDAEIDEAEAHARLKGAFYKFMDVDWVPIEDAVDTARRLKKPIMAVVLTSPLDDQSC